MAKIYKENYRHKHTLKYIREVVENSIDPKFKFEITGVVKTFAPDGRLDRIWNDFNFNKEEKEIFDKVKGNMRPSYTITLVRKDDLYSDCGLDDYIYLIECMKKAQLEFSKKNLMLVPNTIDNEMDFDIIEIDNVFKMSKDNANVSDFLSDIVYDYRTNQGRNYEVGVDDNDFYRTYLINGYNTKTEATNIENVEHFKEYLTKMCKKNGFKFIEIDNFKFNIYTKRQHRMLTIKEVLK